MRKAKAKFNKMAIAKPKTLEEAQEIIASLTQQINALRQRIAEDQEVTIKMRLDDRAEALRTLSIDSRRALHIVNILGIDTLAYIPDSALREMAERIKGVW